MKVKHLNFEKNMPLKKYQPLANEHQFPTFKHLTSRLLKCSGVLAFSLMGLSLSACSSQPSKALPAIEVSQQGLQKVVNYTLDSVVIESARQWQKSASQFQLESRQFCNQPSETKLVALQQSYRQLTLSWNQTLPFDFGPLRDNLFFPKVHFVDSMRQRGKDYSASIKAHFEKRLADTQTLDAQYFNKLKFTLVGMPALEILLYPESKQSLQDFFKNYENPRQCQLLTGLAKHHKEVSDYVVEGWDKASAGDLSWRQKFKTNQLDDGEKSLTKLIFAMQDYLRYVRQRQLNTSLDYARSNLGLEALHSGLHSLERAFTANDSGYGLADYLQKSDQQGVAKEFLAAINRAKQAVKTDNSPVIKTEYSALIKMLEGEIPKALGVNLGMNFVDGD